MFLYVAARLRGGREVEAAVLEAVVTPIVRLLLLSVLSHNAVNVWLWAAQQQQQQIDNSNNHPAQQVLLRAQI